MADRERRRKQIDRVIDLFGVTDEERARIVVRCRGSKYFSIRKIIEEVTRPENKAFHLTAFLAISGIGIIPSATVSIRDEREWPHGERSEASPAEEEQGPVSALCRAIRCAVKIDFELVDFGVQMEHECKGESAPGVVTVEIMRSGRRFIGTGRGSDVVKASALAILDALNRSVCFEDAKIGE